MTPWEYALRRATKVTRLRPWHHLHLRVRLHCLLHRHRLASWKTVHYCADCYPEIGERIKEYMRWNN